MSLIPFILDLADELREFRDVTAAMDVDDFGAGLLASELLQTGQQSLQEQSQQHQRRPRSLSQLFLGGSKLHHQRHHPYASPNKVGLSSKEREQGANGSGCEAGGGGGGDKLSASSLSSSLSSIASAASASPDFFRKLGNSSLVHKNGWMMVSMNVKQFTPDEVSVKTIDNSIVIEGKHGEKEDMHGVISRHFIRKYILPKGYNPDEVSSTMSSDGILTVKAPPPMPPSPPLPADPSSSGKDAVVRIVDIQQIPDTATMPDAPTIERENSMHSLSMNDATDVLAPSGELTSTAAANEAADASTQINTGNSDNFSEKPKETSSEKECPKTLVEAYNEKLEKDFCAMEKEMHAEHYEKSEQQREMHEEKSISALPGLLQIKQQDAVAAADIEGGDAGIEQVSSTIAGNNNDAKPANSLPLSESAVEGIMARVGESETASKSVKADINLLDIGNEPTTDFTTADGDAAMPAITKSTISAKAYDAGLELSFGKMPEANGGSNENGVGVVANAVKVTASNEADNTPMETENSTVGETAVEIIGLGGTSKTAEALATEHIEDPIGNNATRLITPESNGINATCAARPLEVSPTVAALTAAAADVATILLAKSQCEENGTSTTVATTTEESVIAAATI